MTLTNILIFVIFILAFAIPIIIVKQKQKSKKKRLFNTFNDFALKNNLNISQRETWDSHYYIGIDLEKLILLHLNKREEKEDFTIINLNDYKRCINNKVSRSVKFNDSSLLSIDKIELTFVPKKEGIEEVSIPIYIDEIDINLNHELLISDKWEKIINDLLKK